MTDVPVDIVVPIYNARADVEACVASVLRHANGDWRLILVDDASTDETLVRFLKDSAAQHERLVYLRNAVNGGFVVTANHGMRLAEGRDVLLLNSDTIVTERFLEKHIACVYHDDRIGIASPFTNNGTVCSIPEFCQDNDLPGDIDIDTYADLVERISFKEYPELVTAVGFCMYIRAAVIKQIGHLDEVAFGRGFGEENDLCERAKKKGWQIRLVDDCFIAHMGKASFGAEGKALEHENSKVLARMHPNYFPDVHRYIAKNPLRPLQNNVRLHLHREVRRNHRAALFMLHASPLAAHSGGTEFFVRKLVEGLALPRAVIVWPEWEYLHAVEVIDGKIDEAARFTFDLTEPTAPLNETNPEVVDTLRRILELFDVGFVHIHHLLRWPLAVVDLLIESKLPVAYTAHDFLCTCPSFNMIDCKSCAACPCDRSAAAQTCLRTQCENLNITAPSDVFAWRAEHREAFGRLFEHAGCILTPSKFAADRIAAFHSSAQSKIHAISHGYDTPPLESVGARGRSGDTMRVAIFGRMADPSKGTDTYLYLMDQTRDLPIEWHLYGEVDAHGFRRKLDALGLPDRIVIHGNYVQAEICGKLQGDGIDLALILPRCDETFCFVLSEAWLAGVPVIATRRGALVERCETSGAGILVDSDEDALVQLRSLIENRSAMAPLKQAAERFVHPSWADNIAKHRNVMHDLFQNLETPTLDDEETRPRRDELLEAYERAQEYTGFSEPIPEYHHYWWYQPYLYAKPLIPPRMRQVMKRAYLQLKSVVR